MKKSKKGFTLIELLVVVLIIGILAAIAVPQYQKAVGKTRAAEALSIIKSLKPAIDEYILANGTMPKSFYDLSLSPSGEISSQYNLNNNFLTEQYYSYTLIGCRLDVVPNNLEDYAPPLFYQACYDTNWPEFEPGQLYCYYLTTNAMAEEWDKVCKAMASSDLIEYSAKGRAYKL